MGENKTPDLPVQIIKANGGPPLAVLPLPVLLTLVGIAREEFDRVKTESEQARMIREYAKLPLAESFNISSDAREKIWTHVERLLCSPALKQGSYAHATSVGFDLDDDAADFAAYKEAKARDEEALPLAVVKRLAVGDHPVKVFREHRRLTQAELAEAAGTTPAYLSQIETGKRGGSKKLLRALAAALEVKLADLLD